MIQRYIAQLLDLFKSSPPVERTMGAPGCDGIWPVKSIGTDRPTISDGFERPGPNAKRAGRGHLGVDVMFRRAEKGMFDRPQFTPRFWCPSGAAIVVACCPGTVSVVEWSKRNGGVVKVQHGRYMTVYRHLARIDVARGQVVAMGAELGIVGHAPSAGAKGINHLHFEVWDSQRLGRNNRINRSVDPGAWLRHWRRP